MTTVSALKRLDLQVRQMLGLCLSHEQMSPAGAAPHVDVAPPFGAAHASLDRAGIALRGDISTLLDAVGDAGDDWRGVADLSARLRVWVCEVMDAKRTPHDAGQHSGEDVVMLESGPSEDIQEASNRGSGPTEALRREQSTSSVGSLDLESAGLGTHDSSPQPAASGSASEQAFTAHRGMTGSLGGSRPVLRDDGGGGEEAPLDVDPHRRESRHRVFNPCHNCGAPMHIRSRVCKVCRFNRNPVGGRRETLVSEPTQEELEIISMMVEVQPNATQCNVVEASRAGLGRPFAAI